MTGKEKATNEQEERIIEIEIGVKILVEMYSIIRGIFGLLLAALILGTAICYHDWIQVAALAVASAILYLVLFAGVFVDSLLDVTRENIVDFILS